MTQVQEIAQFNRMLDITLGIGEPGEAAQQEQGQDIQRLFQLATVLAADDFRDELRPAQAWRRQADRRARAASTPRWVLPHRRAAFLVMAVLALMLAALLAVGPERALAALRGLLGYLPGIGLVDDSAGLRVLAEPVSQTREGVTVTIEQVVVDSQRTVIVYATEGLKVAAANSAGEGGPFGSVQTLRLPDGITLELLPDPGYGGTPEPLIPAFQPVGGWPNYVSRLVYPPVGADVDELTLVIPILETMPAGAAPENWELDFRLVPAPPDMTFAPITVLAAASPSASAAGAGVGTMGPSGLSSVATANGFTLQLESVVELEDGFVLTGRLSWTESAFPAGGGTISAAVIPTLTDASGQVIPIEEVRLDAFQGEYDMPWSFRTNRKIFAGPLVLSVSTIGTVLFPPAEVYEFDLGPNARIGDVWEIDRDLVLGGHTVSLLSAQLIESPDACWGSVLEFRLTSAEPGVAAEVQDAVPEPPCLPSHGGGGGGGGPVDPNVFQGAVAYRSIPTGTHQYSIRASIPDSVVGPWRVIWEPPSISGPTPSPEAQACLTRDAWTQSLSGIEALPAGLGGRLLVSLDVGGLTPMPDPPPNFPPIELVKLDGSDRQSLVNGGWPALSHDGTRLLYTDEWGFHLLDTSTGQDSLLGVDGYAPIWSPDGSQILYTSFPGLSVMQADGSGSFEIDVAGAEIAPPIGWLPDNRTIIHSVMTGEGFSFITRNLDSGETTQLFSVQNKWGFGSVSPDGQWIAFLDRVFGAGYGVFISRLDGSERRTVAAGDIPMLYRLAWSPDGRWLLVNTQDARPSEAVPAYRPILIELSTCRAIALPDVHGYVEGWVR